MKTVLALLRLAEIYAEFNWKEAARRAFLEAEEMLRVEPSPMSPQDWLTCELERQRVERWVYLPKVV